MLDLDQSGSISINELEKIFSDKPGLKDHRQQLIALMKEADTN